MERCVNHPERDAEARCAGCARPLCPDCIEAREEDAVFCYDCAVERQLSEFRKKGETAEVEKDAVAEAKARRVGSRAFIVVTVVLAVLILGGAGFMIYERATRGGSVAEASLEQEMVWDRDECMMTAQRVREALSEYYQDYDGYPESLQALEGDYLEVEPACPVSGAVYEYKRTAIGYELACPNPAEHGAESITASQDETPHYVGNVSSYND
ncbi:MAG: hypothetical protein SWK76_10545 [Actinomycetota bacterium]|nr:hypothetical protein [Actinomycetota bacterium]